MTLVVANPAAPLPARLPRGPRAARRPPDRRPAGRARCARSSRPRPTSAASRRRRASRTCRTAIVAGADLAIDGGELTGLPSTVVDIAAIDEDGTWPILRDGGSRRRPGQRARLGRPRLGSAVPGLAVVGEADQAERACCRARSTRRGGSAGRRVITKAKQPRRPADVDPLLVVVGGVDVRPADRGAERDPLAAGVLVAAGVDAGGAASAASAGSARGRAGSS